MVQLVFDELGNVEGDHDGLGAEPRPVVWPVAHGSSDQAVDVGRLPGARSSGDELVGSTDVRCGGGEDVGEEVGEVGSAVGAAPGRGPGEDGDGVGVQVGVVDTGGAHDR